MNIRHNIFIPSYPDNVYIYDAADLALYLSRNLARSVIMFMLRCVY